MAGASIEAVRAALARYPSVQVGHLPTPLEPLPRLGDAHSLDLWVKRDDCTGFAFGGNKVRQLAYYVGAAKAADADTILITSAVQSNFMRTAAAMGRLFGMEAVLQLEDRVKGMDALYQSNGNILLDKLLGAEFTAYPEGEDEAGADAAVAATAEALKGKGRRPYVIPLAADKPPLGALGYVEAALELVEQLGDGPGFDEIVVSSGSALTHSGILAGLRAIGDATPVLGACVRRPAGPQAERVRARAATLEAMLGLPARVTDADVRTFDGALAPGYGQLNGPTRAAIQETARAEGLFLDPVYTGKAMASLFMRAETGDLAGKRVLFWHTGGTPALFAYGDQLMDAAE